MDPRSAILTRLYVVLTLLALLPAAVAVQMVRIYVGEGEALRAQGVRQASSHVTIPAMRGTIYDRAGRVLAVNTARFEVALDPTAAGFEARAEALYAGLARLTGRPADEYRRKVARRTSRQYVLLVRSLGEAAKEELEALDVPGLLLTPRFARRYNYGRFAAHVLGHVDTELRGTAGVELQYDRYLRGTDGWQAVQRDRRGLIKAVADGRLVEPGHGQHLVLTIDLVLQSILQEELARGVAETGAAWGAAIAMDPHTGAVLAMANVPDYDPNRPSAFPEAARRNHAITDQIEPGSTFKLVTAAAALEEGVLTPQDSIETGNGWAVFGGRTMRDTRAYGTITFAEAVAKSSNIAFAKVSQRLEDDVFFGYARAFGFGQPTWIDLPGEAGGRLHPPTRWSGSTKTSMSIGYAVSATPLQLLAAYSALANGGRLVQPYVLAERRDVTGRTLWSAPQDSVRRVFSAAVADTLRPLFERVVEEGGTARRAAVEGLRIAGKTGTAQVAEGGRYVGAYRGTFVGFFPADAPEVAVVVVMDRPTNGYFGGTVAAPVFGRVAERWAGVWPALAGRRAGAEALPLREAAPVPDVAGRPLAVAAAELRALGFEAEAGPEPWRPVAEQRPAAGTAWGLRRPVRLAADGRAAEPRDSARAAMPDLRGLSARQATAWLAALGVRATVRGDGAVAEQAPAPGAPLAEAATLTCR